MPSLSELLSVKSQVRSVQSGANAAVGGGLPPGSVTVKLQTKVDHWNWPVFTNTSFVCQKLSSVGSMEVVE